MAWVSLSHRSTRGPIYLVFFFPSLASFFHLHRKINNNSNKNNKNTADDVMTLRETIIQSVCPSAKQDSTSNKHRDHQNNNKEEDLFRVFVNMDN